MSDFFPAIDPLAPLALSIQANRRVFALLLGSGISVSAGIPTGRQVVQLLIRKLACARGQDCGEDPEEWFNTEFGGHADYSQLLAALYPAPSERRNALDHVFEPDELDLIHGRKQPTPAHHAIAQLVKQGFFQVILTTNFDRLLERAFIEAGVPFTMVRSADEAERVDPLQHISTLIIKVNGDYKDPDIRNTVEEVSAYPEGMETLLGRVFSDYGLIVCGWSSASDVGLRRLLMENRSRYTTYWASRGSMEDEASSIVDTRRGISIPIENADTFFDALEMKVAALDRMANGTPLSAAMAAEQVKGYLAEERWDIALRDLVVRETRSVRAALLAMNDLANIPGSYSETDLGPRILEYDSVIARLTSMMVAGCYWGKPRHDALWGSVLGASMNTLTDRPNGSWISLQLYPSLRLLYAGGIAALAAQNFNLLRVLMVDTKTPRYGLENDTPAVMDLFPIRVFSVEGRVASRILNLTQSSSATPMSDKLEIDLRPEFSTMMAEDNEYQRLFDYFEYFRCLVHADWSNQLGGPTSGSIGSFVQRIGRSRFVYDPLREIKRELERDGTNWGPLQAGFFDGSLDRVRQVKTEYDLVVMDLARRC